MSDIKFCKNDGELLVLKKSGEYDQKDGHPILVMVCPACQAVYPYQDDDDSDEDDRSDFQKSIDKFFIQRSLWGY